MLGNCCRSSVIACRSPGTEAFLACRQPVLWCSFGGQPLLQSALTLSQNSRVLCNWGQKPSFLSEELLKLTLIAGHILSDKALCPELRGSWAGLISVCLAGNKDIFLRIYNSVTNVFNTNKLQWHCRSIWDRCAPTRPGKMCVGWRAAWSSPAVQSVLGVPPSV